MAVLFLGYLSSGSMILYVCLILFLAHEFFMIEEIQLSENQIVIQNAFKQVFHFTYDEICVFGKGWGNSIFYIYGVKKRCIPFLFQSLGEMPDKVPEILETLEQLTGKKKGVLYFKRQK